MTVQVKAFAVLFDKEHFAREAETRLGNVRLARSNRFRLNARNVIDLDDILGGKSGRTKRKPRLRTRRDGECLGRRICYLTVILAERI